MKRRDFLRSTVIAVAGTSLPLTSMTWIDPREAFAEHPDLRWIFLVDTHKCVGCGFCVKACKYENEIPQETNATRTWVERYVMTRDGEVHADSPRGAHEGFTRRAIDRGTVGPLEIADEDIVQAFFVPKLCNQCDHPSCVQVCPVGATYKAPDGVVLVDRSWCIGCGYCVMGCPYGVRFFHPVHHVAEKCNFCYHRIHKGESTACAVACPFGARRIGNMKDPDDPVTKAVMTQRVGVLKDGFGTDPQVYYIGLNMEVR